MYCSTTRGLLFFFVIIASVPVDGCFCQLEVGKTPFLFSSSRLTCTRCAYNGHTILLTRKGLHPVAGEVLKKNRFYFPLVDRAVATTTNNNTNIITTTTTTTLLPVRGGIRLYGRTGGLRGDDATLTPTIPPRRWLPTLPPPRDYYCLLSSSS